MNSSETNTSTTKDRIIYESLKLFSEKGYAGVSMREIACAVNIKAASLYAHFKGKEDIYKAIGITMKNRYNDEAHKLSIDGNNPNKDVNVYKQISTEELYNIGKELFIYFTTDEFTKMYRKMLTLGQYEDSDIAREYSQLYYDDCIEYQKRLFAMLASFGAFREADYEIMAIHFFTPIYTLITLYDRQPEREKELLDILRRHIEQFVLLYKL